MMRNRSLLALGRGGEPSARTALLVSLKSSHPSSAHKTDLGFIFLALTAALKESQLEKQKSVQRNCEEVLKAQYSPVPSIQYVSYESLGSSV